MTNMRLLFFITLFFPVHLLVAEKLHLSIETEAAILMNADTGAILYEKNMEDPHYPASITKIATALYTLLKAENLFDAEIEADQDCVGTVTEEALRRSNYTLPAYYLIPDGSHIGIKRGEILTLRDLMYGMMLASGDDAANVIAKFVGGNIPNFMEQLNLYIKSIGCHSTTFYNPHGLHHPKQLTTAYDMAILTKEALKQKGFREIVATQRYMRPKTNKQETSPLVQSNKLVRPGPYYYPKAIGVKTGYYSLAGNTFVAAAEDEGRTLIAVLLKAPNRKTIFLEAKKMFEAAFNQVKVERMLLRPGQQKFFAKLPGGKKVKSYLKEEIKISYYPAEEPEVKCLLQWNKQLKLPIHKDQVIGELLLQLDAGRFRKAFSLYALETIELSKWEKIKQGLNRNSSFLRWSVILGITALMLYFCFKFTLRKKIN